MDAGTAIDLLTVLKMCYKYMVQCIRATVLTGKARVGSYGAFMMEV